MEKNKKIMYSAGLVLIGVIAGFCIGNNTWHKGGYGERYAYRGNMHQMPNGEMMNNVGMDMDSMMNGMMTGLEGKTGDEFDKAFLSEMIVHHKGAVDMAKAVLATSKRPELIKLANDIISAQTKEIDMMTGWQKAWFK
jgi:uncharacterized protein (DUF305 family)